MKKFFIKNKIKNRLELHTTNFHKAIFVCCCLFNGLHDFSRWFKVKVIESKSAEKLCDEVNRVLYKMLVTKNSADYLSRKDELETNLHAIQQKYDYFYEKYAWVKENDKACIWIYAELISTPSLPLRNRYLFLKRDKKGNCIKGYGDSSLYIHITSHENFFKIGVRCLHEYIFKNTSDYPIDHKNRFDMIGNILLFETFIRTNEKLISVINESRMRDSEHITNIYSKTPIFPLDTIKKYQISWEYLYLNDDILKWINPKNEEQLRWIWKYICSHTYIPKTNSVFFNKGLLTTELFKPITRKEIYLSICADIYHRLNLNYEFNNNLLKRMKKSWLQKQRRSRK